MESLDEARKSFEALKVADTSRYDFVEHVLEQMRTILLEKAKVGQDLEHSNRARDSCWQDFNKSQAEMNVLRKSMAQSSFVLVLIDGDAAPFLDEFVRDGTPGGDLAARKLRRSVLKYISDSLQIGPEYKVMIRAYSKMQYLNKTYVRAGIIQDAVSLQSFAQGFNRIDLLCDYIDAGNDKEGADRKIQRTIELFAHNVHCKHIILCASSDESYTGFLRGYLEEGKISETITLVESIPFPHQLAEIAIGFRRVVFPDIFRKTKIVVEDLKKEEHNAPVVTAKTFASVANDGRRDSPTSSTTPTQTLLSRAHTNTNTLSAILVNAANQRVDLKLPYYDQNIVATLKHRKLCNQHFLSRCPYPPGKCNYGHEANLKPADLAALRFVARLGACKNGIYCRDSSCVASHMCIYGSKCDNPDKCRYPKIMHDLDPEPFQSVPASY